MWLCYLHIRPGTLHIGYSGLISRFNEALLLHTVGTTFPSSRIRESAELGKKRRLGCSRPTINRMLRCTIIYIEDTYILTANSCHLIGYILVSLLLYTSSSSSSRGSPRSILRSTQLRIHSAMIHY
ncbi:hypothetical protein M434DRAFT_177638 [Hypoxylon sp. CO27-5]|nr:hypothetical protein M434DRAFT_177638 [Hypoxylon sp. CO27-5]